MHFEGQRIGRYELVRPIGSGGMGDVWLARAEPGGDLYALKLPFPRLVSDPAFRRAFQREAEAQFGLSHPNIVRAIDWIDADSHLGLVLEYVPGENLETRLYGAGEIRPNHTAPMQLDEVTRISVQILDALDTAHRRQWIHRDVKSSNILLNAADGRALLTDFGIGLNLGGKRRTTTGMVAHTVWYMSPEQIRRPKDVDHRTDVYSFGCVLYEMLTGRPPFDADPEEDGDADFLIKRKHLEESPKAPRHWNPELPEQVQAVVLTALAKTPAERFSGCGEFMDALEEAAAWLPQGKAAAAAAGALGGAASARASRAARDNQAEAQRNQRTVPPDQEPPVPDAANGTPAPSTSLPQSRATSLWLWVLAVCVVVLAAIAAATYSSWGNSAGTQSPPVPSASIEASPPPRDEVPASPPAGGAPLPPAPQPVRVQPMARTPPAALAQGVLFISSEPQGASIWIDGTLQSARTNASIKLAYGRHSVAVQLPDGRMQNHTLAVSQGIQHLAIK